MHLNRSWRSCHKTFFEVGSQSSLTRSPVSSNFDTNSPLWVSRGLWTCEHTIRGRVAKSYIDIASLISEIVRHWGWNTQPLRFPTARLPAPNGARKWLSPEKTREIAIPGRFRGGRPVCVIRRGRRNRREVSQIPGVQASRETLILRRICETRVSPPSVDRGGARRVSVNGRLRGRFGLWLGGCPRGQEIQITSRGCRVDVGG